MESYPLSKRLLTISHETLHQGVFSLGQKIGLEKHQVTVLCYHSISMAKDKYTISPKNFCAHLDAISEYSDWLSLDEVYEVLLGNYPQRSAVSLTFDDGYTDFLFQAWPEIKKRNIPVTLFVLAQPEHVDRGELKHQGALLGWEQIRWLANDGVTIGCHGATHANFYTLSYQKIYQEVILAKHILENKLKQPIEYFAYPKGLRKEPIVNAVQMAGYKAAFTVRPACVAEDESPWHLPRIIIDQHYKPSDFPRAYSNSCLHLRRMTDKLKLGKYFFEHLNLN